MGKARSTRETDFAREVGRQIAATRKRLGLSQAELAEALGASQITVSRYEQGAVAIHLFEILKMAAHLKVTLAELVGPALIRTRG